MRWQRDESGQVLELVAGALVLAALAGLVMTIPISRDLAANSRAWQEAQAPAKPQLPPFNLTYAALPNASDARECALAAGKEHNLEWTSAGWRAPLNYPYPTPTGDLAKDKAALDTWKVEIEGYIGLIKHKLEACEEERLPQPKKEGPKAVENWSGTYKVSLQSTATCFGNPDTLPVTHSGPNLTIKVPFPQIVFSATGPLFSDNGFDLQHTESFDLSGTGTPTPYHVRIRGRFDTFNEKRLIRGGVIEITSEDDGTTCTYGFEAST